MNRSVRHGAAKKKTPSEGLTKFQTYPIVLIEWQDAAFSTESGWLSADEFKPCLVAASAIGYKVFEGKNAWDEEIVVLSSALTYQADDLPHFTSSFTIPKKMILNMKEITP